MVPLGAIWANVPEPAGSDVRIICVPGVTLTAGAGRIGTWLEAAGSIILCMVVPPGREVTCKDVKIILGAMKPVHNIQNSKH